MEAAACVGSRLRDDLGTVGYPPGVSSGKQIIPITEIHIRFTKAVIEELLTCRCAKHLPTRAKVITGGVDDLVDKILGNRPECPPAIKIVALLVLVKESHLIIDLMEHRFNDTN